MSDYGDDDGDRYEEETYEVVATSARGIPMSRQTDACTGRGARGKRTEE